MRILGILFFGMLYSMSVKAGICDEAVRSHEERGRHVLACKEVDFGVRAISADYQSKTSEPVAVYPDRVRGSGEGSGFLYLNEIPGILNSLKFNPITDAHSLESSARGHSLLFKYHLAMMRDSVGGKDSELLAWIRDGEVGLLSDLMPDSSAYAWEGRCHMWAAWSIDPMIRAVLDRTVNGVSCSGIPFTRGELKELVTVLYPRTPAAQKFHLKGIFLPSFRESPDRIEDANGALVRLGEFGAASGFSPESLVVLADEAKRSGDSLIFDIDPGTEIWNQPVEAIADVTWVDGTLAKQAAFRVMDHRPVSSENRILFEKLSRLEESLIARAKGGIQGLSPEICEVATAVSESCEGIGLAIGAQVEWFQSKLAWAVAQGYLVKVEAAVESHSIHVRFGVEGGFARTQDEPSRVKVIDYSRVGTRTFWSPPVERLGEVCARVSEQGSSVPREDKNSLLEGPDLKPMCEALRKDSSRDHLIFMGALPPGKIERIRASASLTGDFKSKAFRRFLDLIAGCSSIDEAAGFLREFESALQGPGLSGPRVEALAARYRRVRDGLDLGYVEGRISRRMGEGYLPGLKALSEAIRQ